MELIKKCTSAKDAYVWIDKYNNLPKVHQDIIQTLILKNQYPIFFKIIEQLSKYQLINKLDSLFDTFNDKQKIILFKKFGLFMADLAFWQNASAVTTHFIEKYAKQRVITNCTMLCA